jgi:hypothetical protein
LHNHLERSIRRLKRNRARQVVLQLMNPWRDGTTHIVMSPLELMQRLAALVPRPRLHLIHFHGVLAPHAKLRPQIVPSAPLTRAGLASFAAGTGTAAERAVWKSEQESQIGMHQPVRNLPGLPIAISCSSGLTSAMVSKKRTRMR